MDVQPKKSKSDVIFNLMCSSGLMLIFIGIPAAIILGLKISYDFELGTRAAMILTTEMSLVVAVTGIILYWLGDYLFWKRRPGNKRRWF